MKKLALLLSLFLSVAHADVITGSGFGAQSYKTAVADVASLPSVGNTAGDMRVTLDAFEIYVWDGAAWQIRSGSGGASVTSVFGRSGTVTAQVGDYSAFYLVKANNLSDLASAATARTNLGLGTAATQNSTAFDAAGAAAAAQAFSIQRANHTGTQLSSTISDFTNAAQSAVVTQTITNGVTATAPSEDAVFDALVLKAPLASPALTGNPTAPTQLAGDNSTKIATTAYSDNAAATAASAAIVQTITNGDTTHASSSDALFDALALKQSTTLADSHILVGNGSNVATDVAVSGDLSIANTGAFTIANLAVTNAKIANSTIDLTAKVTGVLPIANGGTNASTALSGSSIMISDGTKITQGAAGTSTTLLHGNAAGAPTYSAASLTTDVTGTLPVGNGGTGKNSWTAGSIVFAGAGGTALTENISFPFSWDNTNSRLNVGATGTGKINVTAAGGTDLALNVFSTAANNAVQVQNQSGYSLSLNNAAASALAGASIGGAFSRGTLASKTQSLAGDQLFSLTSQGYTGSAYGPGFSGAISFVATENTTASANGGSIVLSTTPNGSLTPSARLTIGQNGVVNISNLTASLPVQTNGSKDLVSAAINLSGSQVTSTLGVANGGTGASSLTANNVLLGNGTSALQVVAPSTSGNVLTSNGTTWTSAAPSSTFSGNVTIGGHIIYNGTSTTATVNANAGTSATCSITSGKDGAGSVSLTTGSGSWASGVQCRINFSAAMSAAPKCVLMATNAQASAAFQNMYLTKTTTDFSINFTNADNAAGTYTWDYACFE